MIQPRLATLVGIVLAAALLRLAPHWPNFTPIAAIALFGGAYFTSRSMALAVPLAAMLVSDLFLGFHASMAFVYGAFVATVGLGIFLRAHRTPLAIGTSALAASLLFFTVTNFGAWLVSGLYPLTGAGLVSAYVAGLPFYAPTVAGDLLYTAVLFGGFALAQRAVPALREPQSLPVTA